MYIITKSTNKGVGIEMKLEEPITLDLKSTVILKKQKSTEIGKVKQLKALIK